jgi:hypothetical protein
MIGHLSAYANTLTAIIPDLYAGMDVVSRELVGFVPSVFRNVSAERAAVGQSVVYDIAPTPTAFNVTPAMTVPEPDNFTTGAGSLTISKSRGVAFGWTGEEQRAVDGGLGYLSVQANNFAQGLRVLVNEMETDVANAAYLGASRALGTAGTAPFASDFDLIADMRKILDDNGAPLSERALVMNTSAGANLRKNTQLTNVNESGSTMGLRDGELLNIHGFSLKESAQIAAHTKGTGASSTTNTAGYAVGATVVTLASVGTGTIKAGDVVSFAGDANLYVVASGDTDVSNGGTITLAAPGLRVAIPTSATAITVGGSYAGNVAFTRNALHLVTRAPALPKEGDSAIDRMMITDPRSGMAFEISVYAVYRKIRAEVTAAWGVGAVKPEHIALLRG